MAFIVPLHMLHVYQCLPASLMITQQLYFSLRVRPYPGMEHYNLPTTIKLLPPAPRIQPLLCSWLVVSFRF